jgi:hypothetical protein
MKKLEGNGARSQTTTIGLRKATKAKLDRNRAPGQCYNGFICQLIDLWEEVKEERINIKVGSR